VSKIAASSSGRSKVYAARSASHAPARPWLLFPVVDDPQYQQVRLRAWSLRTRLLRRQREPRLFSTLQSANIVTHRYHHILTSSTRSYNKQQYPHRESKQRVTRLQTSTTPQYLRRRSKPRVIRRPTSIPMKNRGSTYTAIFYPPGS
jgi:hypothetical protein